MAQYHVTGDYPETTSYGTEVFLAKDGVLIGAIVIADTLKEHPEYILYVLSQDEYEDVKKWPKYQWKKNRNIR